MFHYILFQDEEILSHEQIVLIIYVIFILIAFVTLFTVFFISFQKRKNKILIDKFKQQQAFEEELAKTQLEIQEQTLKDVGRELHDNIGQMLAYANMQLNAVSGTLEDSVKSAIEGTKSTIKDSIQEVRTLSKTLNSDVVLNLGLNQSLENEVERINRLKGIAAILVIDGDVQELSNKNDEIFIYRIIQEFLSNSLKYAEATTIEVTLDYSDNLTVTVTDDGKGFDINTAEKGSGLINMKSRAELINADLTIDSKIGEGTSLKLVYKL
ncbi:ATP-binding protein [Winogradskyella sp. 3972H.M.0a.05]|uniref:sensor histidine kinase n=1 Tax=Winogradskyella sp. 3972H.M.0a.05 TaxID=2950277 RepID=UPI00339AE001